MNTPLEQVDKITNIKNIYFGDIDGLGDPKLELYFIDYNFWEDIVRNDVFFVIGKKGTGKSAIYSWIEETSNSNDSLVSNLSFNNFPFEKLLSLSDTNFTKPNQYQSIWENIILTEYARLITLDQKSTINDDYYALKNYIDFIFGRGKNIVETHKKTLEQTQKTKLGLSRYSPVNFEESTGSVSENNYSNITAVNQKLKEIIIQYLTSAEDNRYLIQFDQLDDNYNLYSSDMLSYLQSLISLFKTIYSLNREFRRRDLKSKSLVYLRSDIFRRICSIDSDSSKWDDFIYKINWNISNQYEWENPKLLQILNKRINKTPEINLNLQNPFYFLFQNENLNLRPDKELFKYMIHRSFYRPRDVIQFAKKIQQEVKSYGVLNHKIVKNAEFNYSRWFYNETENEINSFFSDMQLLKTFLKSLGEGFWSFSNFSKKYQPFETVFNLGAEEAAKILYNHGVIININNNQGNVNYYSITRNDESEINIDFNIQLHKGFWLGLKK